MLWIHIVHILRIFVVIGGFLVLLYGLILLPRFRTFPQYMLTTGLLSLSLAASLNQLYDLDEGFNFGLIAGLCGVIFTGLGLFLIRPTVKNNGASSNRDRLS